MFAIAKSMCTDHDIWWISIFGTEVIYIYLLSNKLFYVIDSYNYTKSTEGINISAVISLDIPEPSLSIKHNIGMLYTSFPSSETTGKFEW